MKKLFSLSRMAFLLVSFLVSNAVFTGCGKGSLAVHDSGAFQSAPPELQSQWQIALAAARTNGYVVACSSLQNLRSQPSLNAGQSNAVEELLGVVGTRMFQAANNGDTEATKAMKEVQNSTRRR